MHRRAAVAQRLPRLPNRRAARHREHNCGCVLRAAPGTDVAIVEGVMGLFDGLDCTSDSGSTAQMAKWLGAPVVLVLDCWALSRRRGVPRGRRPAPVRG